MSLISPTSSPLLLSLSLSLPPPQETARCISWSPDGRHSHGQNHFLTESSLARGACTEEWPKTPSKFLEPILHYTKNSLFYDWSLDLQEQEDLLKISVISS